MAAQILSALWSAKAGIRDGAVINLATSREGTSFRSVQCSSTSSATLSVDSGGRVRADITMGNQLFEAPSKMVRESSWQPQLSV